MVPDLVVSLGLTRIRELESKAVAQPANNNNNTDRNVYANERDSEYRKKGLPRKLSKNLNYG